MTKLKSIMKKICGLKIFRGEVSLSLLSLVIVIFFVFAVAVLGYRQLVQNAYFTAKAQTLFADDSNDKPARGSIVSADGVTLAESVTSYILYADTTDLFGENISESYRKRYFDAAAYALRGLIDMSYSDIYDALNTHYAKTYIVLKKELTQSDKDAIEDALSKCSMAVLDDDGNVSDWQLYDCSGIFGFETVENRIYSNNSVASALIGFLNADGDAVNGGVEESYDEILKGTAERIISKTDKFSYKLSGTNEIVISDLEQQNIQLNINYEIQKIMEEELATTVEDYSGAAGVSILMNVNTGAVVGLANYPTYDLNDRQTLSDDYLASLEIYQPYGEKTYAEGLSFLYANQAINQNFIYEPGSINKVLTVAAALDAGVIDTDTAFPCTNISIKGKETPYSCHMSHASNTCLADCLIYSCNPFAVQIARTLGCEKMYDYIEAFGYTEKTGIDLPGEYTPNSNTIVSRDDFNEVELCSYSFGQSLHVSPMQVISMFAACVNGGYLMEPHIVDKITDNDGNVIYENKPVVKRQVISEETSAKMCELLKSVVYSSKYNAGSNVQVSGYSIGGKSGTSEDLDLADKISRNNLQYEERYWASFCAVFPADDPEYAILTVISKVPESVDHGGSVLAGRTIKRILTKALPILGVATEYDSDEMRMPSCVGLSVSDAKAKISTMNVTVYGDGDVITKQYPAAGKAVAENGIVALYTSGAEIQTVTVPNFTGMTPYEAKQTARSLGLNVKVNGNSSYIVDNQDTQAGATVPYGSIITLTSTTTQNVSDG